MKFLDWITGRGALKEEIKSLNFRLDVANALTKSLARDAGNQQERGDALLKALDKARHDRNGYKDMHLKFSKESAKRRYEFECLVRQRVSEALQSAKTLGRQLNDDDCTFYLQWVLMVLDIPEGEKVEANV